MSYIDHSLCLTDEEIKDRIIIDSMMIDKLVAQGHKVRAKVSWHSEATLETHCLPIFETDTMEDVLNRYLDFFPKECKLTVQETQDIKENLYRGDGLSKAKTMMLSFRVPLGLWKMLETWQPGFWDVDETNKTFKHRRKIAVFLNRMKKLRTATPYGPPRVTIASR